MPCPICGKRKAERFCPPKGEKICAICCGTEREVTIDCPSSCPYLIAAHRYEQRHPRTFSPEDIPFRDVGISGDLIYERRKVVSLLAFTILKFAAEHNGALVDTDAIAALASLAETYRTLGSGILYEKPPEAPLPQALYAALAKAIEEAKKDEAGHAGSSPDTALVERASGLDAVKDAELFQLFVFLLRVGLSHTNGRPRARIFLEYLRAQFPQGAPADEAPRIIMP